MKKFKGMKPLDQMRADGEKAGWEFDFTAWDKEGSDWFWIRDMENRMIQVLVNCFGRFFVFVPGTDDDDKPIADETSVEFDDEPWYEEILNLINLPLDDK